MSAFCCTRPWWGRYVRSGLLKLCVVVVLAHGVKLDLHGLRGLLGARRRGRGRGAGLPLDRPALCSTETHQKKAKQGVRFNMYSEYIVGELGSIVCCTCGGLGLAEVLGGGVEGLRHAGHVLQQETMKHT